MPLCRLIVLALKHFEGTLQTDQLISSYLLCKSRWSFRKHVREMSSPRAPDNNVIKVTSLLHHTHHQPVPVRNMSKFCPTTSSDISDTACCPHAATRMQQNPAGRPAPPSGPEHRQQAKLAQGLTDKQPLTQTPAAEDTNVMLCSYLLCSVMSQPCHLMVL